MVFALWWSLSPEANKEGGTIRLLTRLVGIGKHLGKE